ncbi:hypothetical protein V6N11_053168 [Hibiscus sabdariffa]|uniref:Uncharacterized protein n=1 Tax=Hibiscus sabdariffa TaxID=183260 RepID=A0ABR2UCB2_9ROSI
MSRLKRALTGLGGPNPLERMMSMARDPKSRGKQPRSYAKVPKQSLSGKGSDRAMTTRRAQVIHRSDETLKAAFSSVSSGTFCQSGKVFGDNTWRYQNQSTQSESVPKEPPKGLPSDGYTKVTKLL